MTGPQTDQRTLDTHELEDRVKRMYEEVALEPERKPASRSRSGGRTTSTTSSRSELTTRLRSTA